MLLLEKFKEIHSTFRKRSKDEQSLPESVNSDSQGSGMPSGYESIEEDMSVIEESVNTFYHSSNHYVSKPYKQSAGDEESLFYKIDVAGEDALALKGVR